MNITVYCASSAQAPVEYLDAAFKLGQLLADEQHTIYFGGGGVGSMGRLADGALSKGGKVIGIMPRFMDKLEWAHPDIKDMIWTEDMAVRKSKLIENTDAVVALPGGCGTFEELMEVLTLKRLGKFFKPIILLNQNGFYDSFDALFKRSIEDKFMNQKHLSMYTLVDKVQEILPTILKTDDWDENAIDFAAMH